MVLDDVLELWECKELVHGHLLQPSAELLPEDVKGRVIRGKDGVGTQGRESSRRRGGRWGGRRGWGDPAPIYSVGARVPPG